MPDDHASAGRAIEDALAGRVEYSTVSRSFSPHYSDIGLGFDESFGINSLYVHYNRRTTTLESLVTCEHDAEQTGQRRESRA